MLPTALNISVMLTGYLLVMGALALGLRSMLRAGVRPPRPAAERRGWSRLIAHVAGTAVGGYLLLVGVTAAYYYGVRQFDGGAVLSAVTGCATLIGITLPLFLAASWLAERRRRKRARKQPGSRATEPDR